MALDDQHDGAADLVAVDTASDLSTRVKDMHKRIQADRGEYNLFKDYLEGRHIEPYVPSHAQEEVFRLRKRSIVNLVPLLVGIPAQISFCDGFRRAGELFPKEWDAWRRNNMDAKQTQVYRTSLTYGAAYVALENLGVGEPDMNLLSTRDTVAFFHDPVNDEHPVYALTIKSYPLNDKTPGRAVYYDDEQIIHYDYYGPGDFRQIDVFPHNLGVCPVVRYVTNMDDAGSVRGVVEPMIPLQDAVNQTKFDLLVTQTYSSFKVRWASGMMGDPVFNEDGTPKLDADGQQVYAPIPVSQSRWLTTDDPSSKFGTLDETPLDGFIASLEMSIKQFAVVGQLPPHSLLGNMSNLSAETLVAAMSQTMRFGHTLKTSWGGSNVSLLRLAAIDMGIEGADDDYSGEMRWRDMSDTTLATVVDALGKATTMLQVPPRALWPKLPGFTTGEIEQMEEMADEMTFEEKQEAFSPQAGAARERQPARTPTPLETFGGASGTAS